MPRSSHFLGVLVLSTVGAGSAASLSLGDAWYEVGSRYTDPWPLEIVIEIKSGALTWNGVAIRNADIVPYVQQTAQLKPRPRFYLYFDNSDYAAAQLVATHIRDAGGCGGRNCMFKVIGR